MASCKWDDMFPRIVQCLLLSSFFISRWRHQMENFPRCWPFVRGIHRWPVNSPHKGPWCGSVMFSLMYDWINGWVNDREAGDLRRHRVHYDVTVMLQTFVISRAHWPLSPWEIKTTNKKENNGLLTFLVHILWVKLTKAELRLYATINKTIK